VWIRLASLILLAPPPRPNWNNSTPTTPTLRHAASRLIGESANLERVWTEDFRRSGTYHALVISGIHVSVLATFLLALLRLAPISKNSAWALTTAAAWLYALVSGFTMPVARAATGFTLYLIARFFFRRVRPSTSSPPSPSACSHGTPANSEASFNSFLSVAAIGAFAAPLMERPLPPRAPARHPHLSIDPHLEPAAQPAWNPPVAETILL
jgi:competence protein ComEC